MADDEKKQIPKITSTSIAANSITTGGYSTSSGSGIYYSGSYIGTGTPVTGSSNAEIDALKARMAAAEGQNMTNLSKNMQAEQKIKEQEELIAILTEGLSSVRVEIEGISEGVKKLVGERDYWKEIAQNLEIQRQAYLDEETDRQQETDTD